MSERIYVFTPNGAVQELPKDSGPIDFAYAIHTQVGEKATGAKVNGRMVPLTAKLKTGDVMKIITNTNSFGPSRDWINIVKTNKARNKIRQFFKNQDKELSISKGRELLVACFQEHGPVGSECFQWWFGLGPLSGSRSRLENLSGRDARANAIYRRSRRQYFCFSRSVSSRRECENKLRDDAFRAV